MILSPEDGQLYYKLWLPLLDYVNKKYKVNPNLRKMETARSLDPNKVKEVADKLWENVSIIDEYLQSAGRNLPEEHKEIIRSWKRSVHGHFLMERHLKKGTIFISMETEEVYQAIGITSEWEEMFHGAPMPLILRAAFMPFKDVIISDGLMIVLPVKVGGNMKKTFKEIYMDAKRNGRIHKSM